MKKTNTVIYLFLSYVLANANQLVFADEEQFSGAPSLNVDFSEESSTNNNIDKIDNSAVSDDEFLINEEYLRENNIPSSVSESKTEDKNILDNNKEHIKESISSKENQVQEISKELQSNTQNQDKAQETAESLVNNKNLESNLKQENDEISNDNAELKQINNDIESSASLSQDDIAHEVVSESEKVNDVSVVDNENSNIVKEVTANNQDSSKDLLATDNRESNAEIKAKNETMTSIENEPKSEATSLSIVEKDAQSQANLASDMDAISSQELDSSISSDSKDLLQDTANKNKATSVDTAMDGSNKSADADKKLESENLDIKIQAKDSTIATNEIESKKDVELNSENNQPHLENIANIESSKGDSLTIEKDGNKDEEVVTTVLKSNSNPEESGFKNFITSLNQNSTYFYYVNSDNETSKFYTYNYLKNIFLPNFNNEISLPQDLGPKIVLRKIKIEKDSSGVVFEVNVDDSMGPMDFDGNPMENSILNSFCQIALGEGILHHLNHVVLEIYHGNDLFFTKELTFKKCTNKDPILLEKKYTTPEMKRMKREWLYFYNKENKETISNSNRLSQKYLEQYFVPYTLDAIKQNFVPEEQKPVISLENNSNIIFSFVVSTKDINTVKSSSFKESRIKRTCENSIYADKVLPYVDALSYVYVDSYKKNIRKINVRISNCATNKVTETQTK